VRKSLSKKAKKSLSGIGGVYGHIVAGGEDEDDVGVGT
jgi:hypothetical protein